MARNEGIYKRPDSGFWWINATLPNGKRVRQSAGTEVREDAEAYLAKLKLDAYRETHFGIKPNRSWQEAVVRYLDVKRNLRSFSDVQRICRQLDPYLGSMMLNQVNGDVIWTVIQGEGKRGSKPATVNRVLSTMRALFRMARDEWQWIDTFPKIRLLTGEVERDRWLTHEEADRLIRHCPAHLAALVRYALATGCRATEMTGLEWNRVDLNRKTAWLNQTKNGTPRGVPLNEDAIEVLKEQIGKSLTHCFTYRGEPWKWQVSNSAWHTALAAAGIKDFRFHDLRHTWASWHRQAGTSCDELKDLGGWKSREMVDRYAKYGTEHLAVAATRIQRVRVENVGNIVTFLSRSTMTKDLAFGLSP